jgi:hypothetical protein
MNQEPQIPWAKGAEPTSIALLQSAYDRVRRNARLGHDVWDATQSADETIVHDDYSALQHAYNQRHGKPGSNPNG